MIESFFGKNFKYPQLFVYELFKKKKKYVKNPVFL